MLLSLLLVFFGYRAFSPILQYKFVDEAKPLLLVVELLTLEDLEFTLLLRLVIVTSLFMGLQTRPLANQSPCVVYKAWTLWIPSWNRIPPLPPREA